MGKFEEIMGKYRILHENLWRLKLVPPLDEPEGGQPLWGVPRRLFPDLLLGSPVRLNPCRKNEVRIS